MSMILLLPLMPSALPTVANQLKVGRRQSGPAPAALTIRKKGPKSIMRCSLDIIRLALTVLAFAGSATAAQVAARYTITVDAKDHRLNRVSADLPVRDDILQMAPGYAEKLPDRWAKFVTYLVAKDEQGKKLTLNYLGAARWRIPSPLPRAIHLDYSVHLDHDKEHWEFGSKEAAYAKKDWFFYIGRTLFIGSPAQTETVVEFKIPDGWSVTTPWKSLSRNIFEVPTFTELTNVALVLGKYSERTLKVGQTEVTIALGQDLADAMDLFESMLKPLLAYTADFFGGSPAGKFVILANRATTPVEAHLRAVSAWCLKFHLRLRPNLLSRIFFATK